MITIIETYIPANKACRDLMKSLYHPDRPEIGYGLLPHEEVLAKKAKWKLKSRTAR